MTASNPMARDLPDALADLAVEHHPEYLDDAFFGRMADIRQRPAWVFPERWLPMDVSATSVPVPRVPWRAVAVLALVALLVGTALAVYIGARPRLPAPFGVASNGSVAYVAGVGDRARFDPNEGLMPAGDILGVDPVTGVTTTLVGGPWLDREPVFSLDGSRLAFIREVEGGDVLHVQDVGAGEPLALTDGPLPAIRDAAWSPDGASIAFTSLDGARSALWIARTDGSGAQRVPLDPGLSVARPLWRPPDGDEILVVASTSEGPPPGSGYQDLWGGLSGSGGSPFGLYLVRSDGTDVRLVTEVDGTGSEYSHVSWTAQGDRILTQATDTVGNLRVQVLSPDGVVERAFEPVDGFETLAPEVSPDGLRVAYADMRAGDVWRLYVAPIDGSAAPQPTAAEILGGAAAFRWSPDGTRILITHQYFPKTWLVDVDGGTIEETTWTDPGIPTWQRTVTD